MFGQRLEVHESLAEWARDRHQAIVKSQATRAQALDVDSDVPGRDGLYPFQRSGVRFLVTAKRAILADEMGTGKTVQTVCALDDQDAYPALIICPVAVRPTWQEEFEKWADVTVQVVDGSAAKRRKALAEPADVYVLSWDAVPRHSRLASYGSIRLSDKDKEPGELNERKWAAVVADEAHRAKNPKAKRTRALWAVAEGAPVRYALTGTPIANQPDELWSLLHFIDPDEWSGKTRYLDRYCDKSFNVWGGLDVAGLRADTRDEFYECLDPHFLRRPKSLVMRWLPEKVYQRRLTPMTPKQRRAYRSLEDEMLAEVDGGVLMTLSPLQQAQRLGQLASAYCETDETGEVTLTKPSCKVNGLLEVLDEMGNEPAIVFAVSPMLVDLAAEALDRAEIPHERIVGGMSTRDRELAKERFIGGDVRVLFLTLGAGAEGLDGLQRRASTAVFMQRSWSLIQNLQAEDRLHRGGQEETVTIVDLVTPDSIEEAQHDAVIEKSDRLEEITRDRAAIRAALHRNKGGK